MAPPAAGRGLAAIVLVASLLVLVWVFGAPPGERLPYGLEPTVRHAWRDYLRGLVADLDGDGCDEIAVVADGRCEVAVLGLRGRTVLEKGQINLDPEREGWDAWRVVECLDVDCDGASELLVSYVVHDSLRLRAYAFTGRVLCDRFVCHGDDLAREPWWDGKIQDAARVDLADGSYGIVVAAAADYDLYPRGLVMFEGALGRELWRFVGGAQIRRVLPVDVDGDGADEIVFGSSAPGNGAAAGGTTDWESHVGVVDGLGRTLWVESVGGASTDTYVAAVDLDGDGRDEVISLTTPELSEAEPRSRLVVWDGVHGVRLAETRVADRAHGLAVVEGRAGSTGRIFVSTSGGVVASYELMSGVLVQSARGELGVPSEVTGVAEIPELGGTCVLIQSVGRKVSVYSLGLARLAEFAPPGQQPTVFPAFFGTYREAPGRTKLITAGGGLFLLDTVRLGAQLTTTLARVASGVASVLALALVVSGRLRERARHALLLPLVSRLPGLSRDRERLRLELLADLEKGQHDKAVVTRPLRTLVKALRIAEQDVSSAADVTELIERATEDFWQMTVPSLDRVQERLAALGEHSALGRELRAATSAVARAVERVREPVSEEAVPSGVSRSLAVEAERLEMALSALREALASRYRVDVIKEIERARQLLREEIVEAGFTVEVQTEGLRERHGWAYPPDFLFVVCNMITNAIRATEGKGARKLTIKCRTEGNFIEIEFEDTGCGIEPQLWERIFEYGITTNRSGTGTGLFRSRECLKPHGGSVRVLRSQVGVGTTFAVTLRARWVKEGQD